MGISENVFYSVKFTQSQLHFDFWQYFLEIWVDVIFSLALRRTRNDVHLNWNYARRSRSDIYSVVIKLTANITYSIPYKLWRSAIKHSTSQCVVRINEFHPSLLIAFCDRTVRFFQIVYTNLTTLYDYVRLS